MNLLQLRNELEKKGYTEDYIGLCEEYGDRLKENGLPIIFDRLHLSLLIGLDLDYLAGLAFFTDDLYKEIRIPKKAGGFRKISIPSVGLKYVQRWILDNVLYKMNCSQYAFGFVPEYSIVHHARKHLNKDVVITMDFKDFFPSIKFETVFKIFNYYGYTNELSFMFAKLCTHFEKLPQGAPTSPYISNIVCLKLDKRLGKLCEKLDASYSRYADDLTFSGSKGLRDCLDIFRSIISDEGFEINEEKTRIRQRYEQQKVTGLIVNEKLSVPSETKRFLKQQIYFCKKFGVINHMDRCEIERSNYKEYLYGLAFFIKMVEEDVGNMFIEELHSIDWFY